MIRDLGKMPKRKIKIDEILGYDDIVGILDNLQERIDDIKDIMVIYSTKSDNQVNWQTNGINVSRSVYLCELVKHCILEEE